MGIRPFFGRCYSDACGVNREFINPRKVRNLTDADVEALIVRFTCSSCKGKQDFVMTPLNALEAGLKNV